MNTCKETRCRTIPMDDPNNVAVAYDILCALQQQHHEEQHHSLPSLLDVQLLCSDGTSFVPACRFVLAARSRIFRHMLYNTNFRNTVTTKQLQAITTASEKAAHNQKQSSLTTSPSSAITNENSATMIQSSCLIEYDRFIVRAIVHYCSFNVLLLLSSEDDDSDDISGHEKRATVNELYVRQLMQLRQASDYLELYHLVQLITEHTFQIMSQYPLLVCVVYDEVIDEINITNEDVANAVSGKQQHRQQHSSPKSMKSSNQQNPNTTSEKNQSLSEYAFKYIECRPYATLDDASNHNTTIGGGIASIHDPQKVQRIMQSKNISASELFLFHMIIRWLECHSSYSDVDCQRKVATEDEADSNSLDTIDHRNGDYYTFVKECIKTCIQLQNIEPNELLLPTGAIQQAIVKFHHPTSSNSSSSSNDLTLITQEQLFHAVGQQALRSSIEGVWRIRYRPGHYYNTSTTTNTNKNTNTATTTTSTDVAERVLVENAGSNDVNGMYYRITGGLNLANGELYSKREVMYGQLIVYTLSCCTKTLTNSPAAATDASKTNQEEEEEGHDVHKNSIAKTSNDNIRSPAGGGDSSMFREYRIFSSQFLTYRAIQRLDNVQRSNSTSWVSSQYQPVLQVIQIMDPADAVNASSSRNNNNNSIFEGGGDNFHFSFYSDTNPYNNSNITSIRNLNTTQATRMINVPTPIRKYYRVRLSDGTVHMAGTFSRELSSLLEQKDITINTVIKVLEYGLYQVATTIESSCMVPPSAPDADTIEPESTLENNMANANNDYMTCIHVIKAAVVTTSPVHIFGQPIPLEVYNNNKKDNQQQHQRQRSSSSSPLRGTNSKFYRRSPSSNSSMFSFDNDEDDLTTNNSNNNNNANVNNQGLQNLYICRCPVLPESDNNNSATTIPASSPSNSIDDGQLTINNNNHTTNTKIPRTGWVVDTHGIGPAPTCTWIPASSTAATTSSSLSSISSSATATSSKIISLDDNTTTTATFIVSNNDIEASTLSSAVVGTTSTNPTDSISRFNL